MNTNTNIKNLAPSDNIQSAHGSFYTFDKYKYKHKYKHGRKYKDKRKYKYEQNYDMNTNTNRFFE